MTPAAGRVALLCCLCRRVVAYASEQKIQFAAGFTQWRGKSSEKVLEAVTDSAAVKCTECEQAHAGNN